MMNKRSLILGMALTLMPAGQATAQDAAVDAQQDRYERRAGRRDRFYLNIGGVFLRHDSVDELNARGLPLGTVIDWEDVFGLPESTSSVRVEAHYKFTPRHRVRASYFTTARAADQVPSMRTSAGAASRFPSTCGSVRNGIRGPCGPTIAIPWFRTVIWMSASLSGSTCCGSNRASGSTRVR